MRYLKLGLLLFGCLFGLQRAARELSIAAQEESPTRLSVDHWEQYQGQQWLTVDGRLAVERAVIRGASDKVNRAKGNVYAYVPIVPTENGAGEPVHAVAVIGPLPAAQASHILQGRAGPATISGQIAPEGVYDHARLIPGEQLDPKAVFVNENTRPIGGAGMWCFFQLMLAGVLFSAFIIWRDWRRWARSGTIETPTLITHSTK